MKSAIVAYSICSNAVELDELFWFIEHKPRTETRENVYLMTMVSRQPRQYVGYLDVVYPGQHVRNMRDKSDTFTVEGVNADLRHYIPILARRSRCFPRTLETLQAVVEVFVDAYNRFGQAQYRHRLHRPTGDLPFGLVDFL